MNELEWIQTFVGADEFSEDETEKVEIVLFADPSRGESKVLFKVWRRVRRAEMHEKERVQEANPQRSSRSRCKSWKWFVGSWRRMQRGDCKERRW